MNTLTIPRFGETLLEIPFYVIYLHITYYNAFIAHCSIGRSDLMTSQYADAPLSSHFFRLAPLLTTSTSADNTSIVVAPVIYLSVYQTHLLTNIDVADAIVKRTARIDDQRGEYGAGRLCGTEGLVAATSRNCISASSHALFTTFGK